MSCDVCKHRPCAFCQFEIDAKQRHDELASERAAGRRDAETYIASKLREHADELSGNGRTHAIDLALWIERGCK